MRKQQKGFTLIELVMVIVILGILAAFALPKFADLSGEAETAACRGGMGAVRAAAGIAHAADLAGGSSGTVSLEGGDYVLLNGYPTAELISEIANLDGFVLTPAADTTATTTRQVEVRAGGPSFTYTEAINVGDIPGVLDECG